MTHEESLITHMVSQLPWQEGVAFTRTAMTKHPASASSEEARSYGLKIICCRVEHFISGSAGGLSPGKESSWAIQQRHPVNRFILKLLETDWSQETWRASGVTRPPLYFPGTYVHELTGNKETGRHHSSRETGSWNAWTLLALCAEALSNSLITCNRGN